MKNIRQDKPFLRMFLRGCNYKLEATKDKLDMYFTVRTLLPVWFDNWDPAQASLEAIFSAGIYLPLRGYDKKGRYNVSGVPPQDQAPWQWTTSISVSSCS